jgi:putative methionine-R-sulfoxide reductase with GAF domain
MTDPLLPDEEESADPTPALSRALQRMSGLLVSEHDLTGALQLVTGLAVDTIPAAIGAGVTLLPDDQPRTTAATGAEVQRADAVQYELDEGPCLSAARAQRIYRIDSMWAETRWPRWTAAAAALGLGSSLSAPLLSRGAALGAIKVYSDQEHAFAERDERLLQRFAEQAAILLANVSSQAQLQALNDHLREALRSRDVIGQAKGMLRLQHRIDEQAAFAMLVAESDRTKLKLREIAQRMLDDLSPPPPVERVFRMNRERRYQDIEAGRRRGQLDLQQLWLRYVALGGNAGPLELEAYLTGLLPLDPYDEAVLAQAVKERLAELQPPPDESPPPS